MAHPRLIVGGSLVIAVVLAGGAAFALSSATGDKGSSSAAPSPAPLLPTEGPVPTVPPVTVPPVTVPPVTVTPTPPAVTPSATPLVSVTPSAAPSPSRVASSSPAAAPTSSAPTTRYAYPKPTRSYTSLYLAEVGYDPDGDSTHDAPYLKTHAVDGDGIIRLGQITWGDGTVTNGPGAPAACGPRPSPTTRPGPYQPEGDDRTFVNDHTYKRAGTYTISVTVDSGNADCRPNGPASESATLSLMVTVNPS